MTQYARSMKLLLLSSNLAASIWCFNLIAPENMSPVEVALEIAPVIFSRGIPV